MTKWAQITTYDVFKNHDDGKHYAARHRAHSIDNSVSPDIIESQSIWLHGRAVIVDATKRLHALTSARGR